MRSIFFETHIKPDDNVFFRKNEVPQPASNGRHSLVEGNLSILRATAPAAMNNPAPGRLLKLKRRKRTLPVLRYNFYPVMAGIVMSSCWANAIKN